MRIAIMQPYFLPYIGYWQLMNYADVFIIYDNIQYTKKGWINRNRYLENNKDKYFTIPLKKSSDFIDICDKELADDCIHFNQKTLRKIVSAYRNAPYFAENENLLVDCFSFEENNLFKFITNSIKLVRNHLGISTELIVSSCLDSKELSGVERVVDLCKRCQGTIYINPIGGINLYNKDYFTINKLHLFFLKTNDFRYNQFDANFIPYLSIIDNLMFEGKRQTQMRLTDFELI